MIAADPYNDEVRERFENPVHAGEPGDGYDTVLAAEAGAEGQGARVVLAAGVAGGRIETARFRAWGCPHLVAAADLACEMLEGGASPVSANELMSRLSVPVEKTGRMLLVEDAAEEILRKMD